MATIQYTSYKFRKPPLIDENEYNLIKLKLKNNPNYNPFPVESFWQKYKIVILLYVVGLPFAGLLASFEIGFLEIISGIYAFLLFGALFSFIPEWLSYLTFLAKRKLYYSKLLKKIKISEDYYHFRDLML